MKKLILSALPLVLLMSFSGCKKKNDEPQATKTQHISKSPWRFEKATASGFDVTAQVPACYKDNIISFSANGTGTVDEGANVCNPPTASNFTWSFNTGETVLIVSSPLFQGGSGNFDIITLNDVNLVLSQEMTLQGTTTTVVITFKH